MKKILIINTKYRIFGGEDSNISDEINLLSKFFDVEYLEYDNDKFSFFDLASFIVGRNFKSEYLLKNKINEFNPDLAYVHNLWFKGQVGIFKILKLENIQTIHKIHNFRYSCSNSLFFKRHLNNNQQCFMCGLKYKRSQIFNNYFFNSRLKSLLLIIFTKRYLKIVREGKFLLFALNEFHKKKLIEIGISEERIKVFYNPISFPEFDDTKYNPKSDYVVYAGRLEENKGIDQLLEAWVKFDSKNIKIKVLGEGNLKQKIIKKYSNVKNIEFLGLLSNEEAKKCIKESRAVLTATKLYEGHPKLLAEASSMGIPSIYPSFGGIDEYFPKNYQLSFEQFNYFDLIKKLQKIDDPLVMQDAGKQVFIKTKEILGEKTLINNFKNFSSFNEDE